MFKWSAALLALTLLTPLKAEAQAIHIACGQSMPSEICQRIVQHFEKIEVPVQLRLELGTSPAPVDLAEEEFLWQAQKTPEGLTLQVWGKVEKDDPTNRGLLYGSYALLERLGFRFNHPFQVLSPPQLNLPSAGEQHREKPFWPQRGLVHHTMHPLEMTHVLNGWGPGGPSDPQGWESLRGEWESYLEWLIANRQNEVEWVLLEKGPWQGFSRSTLRQKRLKSLVEQAHRWGIKAGIDVPLALGQQNAWRLVTRFGELRQEQEQIRENLDWLMEAGFDFVSTELGLSEFHNAGDQLMLDWLNTATAHLEDQYHKHFYTKIHISSGQVSERYRDPQTGAPLNFNFLPHYADPRLGIMPHTVQIYSLDDPAPTYGHQDFSQMHQFIRQEAGRRPLLWFPESSYWVNYDINQPLFLPVYAARRLHDIWILAGSRLPGNPGPALDIQGQMLFSSGFEWGYWLNDRISSRAAWSPDFGKSSEAEALHFLLFDALQPAGAGQMAWTELLEKTIASQYRLLVLGQLQGKNPREIEKHTGMAYLAGVDAWSEIAALARKSGILKGFQTQPDRLEPEDLRKQPQALQTYLREIRPLLAQMHSEFKALAREAQNLQRQYPSEFTAEFVAGLEINALRAGFKLAEYEHAALSQVGQKQEAAHWLAFAKTQLNRAQTTVKQRESHYRTDPERIAGWGLNPTAYRYGYLWQARALSFWKRDLLAMETGNTHPCRLNTIDPLEVALPDPDWDSRALLARDLGKFLPGWRDCLFPGENEPDWAR
ncbi:hypothetical protein COW36_05470 [bacterium (Candidatus Blackallbacteria) CG17_big_fil_post_rev_8_21_14_2_50_48_46]|uniref:Alpha glucuronidase N-terminal domain-containing protein n=1 Tax=bacterium (Candidatus Blackallbacteria) CG17_big_fil_post_rev_8_21_14_2_50_48_46 TaxID=2014261 RepID=A0A2M7G804_9BACT|nr:MAG: hypothetical protein COW64_21065 [bacterium (Candidatus Blackallbacteria) CG18_big_fil_WC_8_21_14_2_50_49_26]PIW18217.1 MAG: hypothetical protein COW36_05470 [bacterium (Candidatus Blackallbacteria) CG17_big_fil_post_rev_8_21_14_2_50_48_46]PIW50648.1 MAG: hypothetical protein COW20_01735 [bacterium (Candidatus Blackallbacteria) CG13_big_fil_rev_8_21_14_2_50_49_14]